jgi:hypothetical protein
MVYRFYQFFLTIARNSLDPISQDHPVMGPELDRPNLPRVSIEL